MCVGGNIARSRTPAVLAGCYYYLVHAIQTQSHTPFSARSTQQQEQTFLSPLNLLLNVADVEINSKSIRFCHVDISPITHQDRIEAESYPRHIQMKGS